MDKTAKDNTATKNGSFASLYQSQWADTGKQPYQDLIDTFQYNPPIRTLPAIGKGIKKTRTTANPFFTSEARKTTSLIFEA